VKHLEKQLIGGIHMDIKQLFSEMNQKLDILNQGLNAKELSKDAADMVLENLKAQSEEIVEEWLKFEEKLGKFLRREIEQEKTKASLITGGEYETLYKKLIHLNEGEVDGNPSTKDFEDGEEISLEWQKGKALYDLLMFEKAAPFIEAVTKKRPEFEPAKLYLAHSYLAIKEWEKARYYLQFLIETTENQDILHLSLHAFACIEGLNKNYAKSAHFFEKIETEKVREEWKSIFIYNYAQTLFHLERLEESLDIWIKYYELKPDDWQGPYMIGKVYLQKGDEEAGLAFWFESLQLQENNELLKEMAKHFEARTFYQMAAQCYERLLREKRLAEDEEVWFGLAWNYGLSQDIEKSEATFLKALSLFPNHVELQISYTWMLLLWNKQEKAQSNLSFLSTTYGEHPLVRGLSYLYEGKYGDAMDVLADSYYKH
jgi:tetratricopeptide (TPR) repeat protein